MMFRRKLSSSISCWYPRVEKDDFNDDGSGSPSHGIEVSSSGIWGEREVVGIFEKGIVCYESGSEGNPSIVTFVFYWPADRCNEI